MTTVTSAGIHAYLSETSHAAWLRLAHENGATLAALLEAFGLHLEDGDLRPALGPIIADAQRVTIERRRR